MTAKPEPGLIDVGLIEPVTGLRLPPLPRTPYNGRSAKYWRKISVPEFVEQEWGDYTHHYLLYTEHLRHIDFPLYKACYYQARLGGKTFAAYVLGLGILAKQHVLNPKAKYRNSALILQAVRLRVDAELLRVEADRIYQFKV